MIKVKVWVLFFFKHLKKKKRPKTLFMNVLEIVNQHFIPNAMCFGSSKQTNLGASSDSSCFLTQARLFVCFLGQPKNNLF